MMQYTENDTKIFAFLFYRYQLAHESISEKTKEISSHDLNTDFDIRTKYHQLTILYTYSTE